MATIGPGKVTNLCRQSMEQFSAGNFAESDRLLECAREVAKAVTGDASTTLARQADGSIAHVVSDVETAHVNLST